jgi:hypothetical protein
MTWITDLKKADIRWLLGVRRPRQHAYARLVGAA